MPDRQEASTVGRVGRYEIVGQLAVGGMATILLGRLVGPRGFEQVVVIKRILPHLAAIPEFVDMFVDEARIVAGIRHPNVVAVHELGREGEELFLVMEYLDGESAGGLMRRLRVRDEELDRALAIHIVAEACAGLHAAHELPDDDGRPRGLVHRDVSPQNVFVTYAGGVKVIDFGIAKAADRVTKTEAGQLKGKFEYMSPEQCASKPLDRRSDVFALGILLFELGAGRRLFKRESELETLKAICEEPVARPSDASDGFPPALEAICMRALSRRPADRYPTAAAMRMDLLDVLRDLTPRSLPEEALGSMMRRTFADRIEDKREMLRCVRSGSRIQRLPTAETDRAVELPSVMVTSEAARASLEPRHDGARGPVRSAARRARRWRWVLPTSLVAGALAATWVFAVRPDGRATPDDPAPTSAPAGRTLRVALLPFFDRTGEAQLDFAANGLAHMIASELELTSDVKVISHYRLLEVVGPGAPAEAWRAEAKRLGADIVLRGELDARTTGVSLQVTVERIDGTALETLTRDVESAELPRATQALVPEIAAVLGAGVRPGARTARSLAAERSLQLGIAALEGHRLADARLHLTEVLRVDPASVDANYALAIAAWWQEAPVPETVAAIDRALVGPLPPARAAFMSGLRLLVQQDYTKAVEHFRRAASEHPDQRDVLYGAAEALYHGGWPGEAIPLFRRVYALSPRFRLGFNHVLDFYAVRGDEAGLEWVRANAQTSEGGGDDGIGARVAVARRDTRTALERLPRAGLGGVRADVATLIAARVQLELMQAQARDLDSILAANEVALLPMSVPRARLSVAVLRGDSAARERIERAIEKEVALVAMPSGRYGAWVELLLFELPVGRRERLRALDQVFTHTGPDTAPVLTRRMQRVVLAGMLGDAAMLERARAEDVPEAAETATGFLLESAGDFAGAARAYERAMTHTSDGKFALAAHWLRARALRSARDHAGVIAACHDVLAARILRWEWSAFAPSCLLWTGEAALRLGRRDEARPPLQRLAGLRAGAPGDALGKAATKALAELGTGVANPTLK